MCLQHMRLGLTHEQRDGQTVAHLCNLMSPKFLCTWQLSNKQDFFGKVNTKCAFVSYKKDDVYIVNNIVYNIFILIVELEVYFLFSKVVELGIEPGTRWSPVLRAITAPQVGPF